MVLVFGRARVGLVSMYVPRNMPNFTVVCFVVVISCLHVLIVIVLAAFGAVD